MFRSPFTSKGFKSIYTSIAEIPKISPPPQYKYNVEPVLARPWINIETPRDTTKPFWLSSDQYAYAKFLFTRPVGAHPVLVAQTIHNLPKTDFPQVAMIGQSNSGKSSLINALMYGKELARSSATANEHMHRQLTLPTHAPVSDTPGRTRHLFTFDLSNHLSLVDLPGYGYAKVSKEVQDNWGLLIDEYFKRSTSLSRVISLIDARKGVEDIDKQLWSLLLQKNKKFMVVLTKVDQLVPADLHTKVLKTIAAIQEFDAPESIWPVVHAVSARQGMGIAELRCSLSLEASDFRTRQGNRLIDPNAGYSRRIGME